MARRFCSEAMIFRTFLMLVVLHSSRASVTNLTPMLYENPLQNDGIAIEYPNPEAKFWNVLTPSLNSDYLLKADLNSEDEITEAMLDNDGLIIKKRPNVKLIPRIGRKKRSISGEDNKASKDIGQPDLREEVMKKNWVSDLDQEYFIPADKRKPKNKVVFIPRIGKKSFPELDEVEEKRAIFIPRIGKKSSSDLGEVEEKRAIFIPRIGKKSATDPGEFEEKRAAIFIPRIGKKSNSDRVEVEEKRAAIFIPRIGKKSDTDVGEIEEKRAALFIPRIGRGSFITHMTRYNPQYRAINRAAFIPRIG